jgi:hypothetical protein
MLPDPLEGPEDRGVEPAVRHPARTIDGCERAAGPPRDLNDPARTREPVEHRQLGVVAEPGQRDIHGVELRLNRCPRGIGRGLACGALGG